MVLYCITLYCVALHYVILCYIAAEARREEDSSIGLRNIFFLFTCKMTLICKEKISCSKFPKSLLMCREECADVFGEYRNRGICEWNFGEVELIGKDGLCNRKEKGKETCRGG